MFNHSKNKYNIPIFDFCLFIYKYMKQVKEEDKKVQVSVTLEPQLIELLDEKTSNRSNLINWLLKEYFVMVGEDVSDIKL